MRTRSKPQKSRWWRNHVDSWQKSGTSQRKYCQANGLALSTFQLWRRRLVHAAPSTATVEIVPVPRSVTGRPYVLEPAPAIVTGLPIVLWVGDGRYRLELSDGVNGSTLRTVLSVLETRS